MGFFKKKSDPISERARALKAEIEALEAQIKNLSSKTGPGQSHARTRSGTWPPGSSSTISSASTGRPSAQGEPVLDLVDHKKVTNLPEAEMTPAHYNDLGVRKYDLLATWQRIRNHFHGPTAPNPKLVSYLAAGTIKGLRPLRYEKRIVRNRFILFSALLLLVIWVFLAMVLKQR